MARDETTDIVAAFIIGAALGIGATILLKDDETEVQRVLRKVSDARKRSAKQLSNARDHGEDLVRAGRRTAAALREEAADIVSSARDEIQSIARDSVRRVRKATAR